MKKKFDVLEILNRNGISGSTLNTINIQDGFKPTNIQVDNKIMNSDTKKPQNLQIFNDYVDYKISGQTYVKFSEDFNINNININKNNNSLLINNNNLNINDYIIFNDFDIIKYHDKNKDNYLIEYDQAI